ncbi:MAG: hypothetical protein Sapg2KO_18880 [Saprospiraceae bacterium]
MVLGLGFTSCENTELDLLDNPNSVTPENASLNELYNNIQLTFRNIYNSQGNPGVIARMYGGTSTTYNAMTTPTSYNGLWNNVYAGLLPDIEALLGIADAGGFDIHAGSAKIMEAYSLMVLVDLLGDVPFSQAVQGTDFISPASDSGADIYATAIGLLDEAIALLSGTNASRPAVDIFYGGDADKWIKAANSLKIKAAITTRLVDGSAASTINSIVSSGNFISDASDDFEFQYGNQRVNPNSRHPFYQSHYEIGDGAYLSNYFMWLVTADKEGVTDPRANYYFYRKVPDAEGQDATTYSCGGPSILPDQSAKPPHWEQITGDSRLPYCVLPGTGYSGRDHGNGDGIPPDGPIRTSYGLYPGGGQFDDETFEDTRQRGTSGGLGEGILPILPSFVVDFMRAEAALVLGTNDDAAALLEKGIRASFAKVESFESLVSSTMSTVITFRDGSTSTNKEFYGITDDKVDAYVTDVLALYNAGDADTKLDILVKEFMIAAWGNGYEAYNLYRRTGKPNNMMPTLDPNPGDFPRSMFYPNDHVTRNANVSQKALADRVFWDDGSVDLY